MKRLFILATAAIVALASCAKTEVVYTDAPEEIGFKAVTGVMTKAAILDGTYTETSMYVYSWKNEGKTEYESVTTFTNSGDGKFKASPSLYYPNTGALDFVAFTKAPTSNTGNKSYSLTLADNTTTQHDLMASSYVVNKDKAAPTVNLPFYHTLALVSVNFKCTGLGITVKSVSLAGTKQAGDLTVTYSTDDTDTTPTTSWSPTGEAKTCSATDLDLSVTAGALEFENAANFLVVPEDGTGKTLTVVYEDENGFETTAPINLDDKSANDWSGSGKKYNLDLTVGATEIVFTASVEDWGTGASYPL